MMKRIRSNWFWIILLVVVSSCVPNKKFVYLQDKGHTPKTDSNGVFKVIAQEYKLKAGDILYLALTTDDEKLNKIFVPGTTSGSQMFNQSNMNVSGTMFYFIGFTIGKDGHIELPYLGKIYVADKTIEEAKMAIETELKKYFKVFFLQAKVGEFKFSVLGMVNKPGQYFFNQNQVTILEAIAQAGDLQDMAKKYEVQLYRKYPDGVKLINLDLTDKSIIGSEYWLVQPGDILYVQPLKIRTFGNVSNLQNSFAVISPVLSSLLLVLNTIIIVRNLK